MKWEYTTRRTHDARATEHHGVIEVIDNIEIKVVSLRSTNEWVDVSTIYSDHTVTDIS